MIPFIKIANAQTFSKILSNNPTISPIYKKILENIITPVVDVLFAVAFVVFIWGILGLITSQEDTEKRKNAKSSIMWGVIGMVIMISVYGIVRLIASTLGVPDPFL